ncbi:MAG: DUF6484 domain-containing protein [Leptothrix sp. (in: b-proteobacteria)]
MDRAQDPFIVLAEIPADRITDIEQHKPIDSPLRTHLALQSPVVGKLHGFDLLEQPLISNIPLCPGQVLPARTTVPLKRAMIGRDVVVWFDSGELQSPIIMGVIEIHPPMDQSPEPGITVQVDNERYVVQAEREIVLRCGDASITLTRAGKVIIKGNYIMSRSTGYNKIKGAAIDIN